MVVTLQAPAAMRTTPARMIDAALPVHKACARGAAKVKVAGPVSAEAFATVAVVVAVAVAVAIAVAVAPRGATKTKETERPRKHICAARAEIWAA